ncbi:sugar-binding domain-containing protein, partial [Rhizobium leguminosarum]|uniref:sugar-binding domain-containing protein n=1 Tax=Rhizobium leguminosarum TaxID=384 RepID=UPI003F9BDC1E
PRRFNVEVIPATGCVQGKHYTDVNHVSTLMADRLGGRSYQIHAPLFADDAEQRAMPTTATFASRARLKTSATERMLI